MDYFSNALGPKHDFAVSTFERFKFVVAFENTLQPGYITEKILGGILAGAIPIFFGFAGVDLLLNPRRYIHCRLEPATLAAMLKIDFSGKRGTSQTQENQAVEKVKEIAGKDLRVCIDEVRRIDQDDQAYARMVAEPLLVEDRFADSIFDPDVYARQIYAALSAQQSYLISDD